MLTWILLAIIVAALLGYINVDKVRAKLIELYNQYLPQAKKALDAMKAPTPDNHKSTKDTKKDEEK